MPRLRTQMQLHEITNVLADIEKTLRPHRYDTPTSNRSGYTRGQTGSDTTVVATDNSMDRTHLSTLMFAKVVKSE